MDRYGEALAREVPGALPGGWTVTLHAQPRYPRWTRFGARWLAYPVTIDWNRFDIVHVTDHSYAHILKRRRGHARTVLTVHDLFAFDPLARKVGIRGAALRRVNSWVLEGIKSADACLCDSLATMSAVVDRYPEVTPRVRCQRLGVDERFFAVNGEIRTRGRALLRVPGSTGVILHVGSCVQRKNLPALIDAFARLAAGRTNLRLVQVGGCFTREQRQQIEALGVGDRIYQKHHVADEDLPSVYAAADVVAVPSLFEGFGLPVLEAFAAGTPVAASRNAALAEFPEHLLEPAGGGSSEELAFAIGSVLDDAARAHARACLAREWARRFTWLRTAREVADVYRSLLC